MWPTTTSLGGLETPSYALAIGLGASLLLWLSVRSADRDGLAPTHIAACLLTSLLGGLAGARALFVVENLDRYPDAAAALLSPYPGGFASHGALLGGALAVLLYCRLFRLSLGRTLDAAAVGLPAFAAVGRLGCFAAGCCHGGPTDAPWGIVFPAESAAAAAWGVGAALHPAQLYEAAYLAAIAVWMAGRKSGPDGAKFATLLAVYAAARFLSEFARGDVELVLGGLSLAQWMSVGLAMVAALLLTWKRQAGQPQEPALRRNSA